MKLLGISGSLTGSKTLTVVKKVLDCVQAIDPEIETQLLDLKQFDMQFCDGRDHNLYNLDTKKMIDMVAEADFYVIGTPVFQASLSGALKNLIDLIPVSKLRYKVMGFIATGGTYQHYLVIENQLKPIAGYFRAFVAPSYVYVHNDHFNQNNEIADREILERIQALAKELVVIQKSLKIDII